MIGNDRLTILVGIRPTCIPRGDGDHMASPILLSGVVDDEAGQFARAVPNSPSHLHGVVNAGTPVNVVVTGRCISRAWEFFRADLSDNPTSLFDVVRKFDDALRILRVDSRHRSQSVEG